MPIPITPINPLMTSSGQTTLTVQNQPKPLPPEFEQGDPKKRAKDFRARIESCKQYRKKLIPNWTLNIDVRRGKPFASQTDEDRINVPLDWSLTKAKQASLFSQVPKARVDHHPDTQTQGPWLQAFERKLNDVLIQAGIETAMDECLPDCINAAGFGVVLVSHDAITDQVDLQTTDPALGPGEAAPVPRVLAHKYSTQRISPSDFLWPIDFTGADFDQASWVGRSGRVTWAEAVRLFGLTDADKDKALGEDRSVLDHLTNDIDKDKIQPDEKVGFDEIWYKEYQYDETAKSYDTLHHMVFVGGKTDPVIDKPWDGQKLDPTGATLIGASKFPIRVLTLTYITDETIPPSDTAMGRSQVNEINKSRTQMVQQRERNQPVRWMDINRIDQSIQQALMRGTWQGFIPVQGQGNNVIGEVARSSHPAEDFTFNDIAKADLTEIWNIGPNQVGSGRGIETASESDAIQGNFQTRVTRERAKVARFFVGVAEVLGGLICLYEDPASFGPGFDPALGRVLNFSILADSTVIVDAQQRLQRLIQFVNFTAKSGYLDIEPVLKEIATLSGLDPNVVIKKPEPPPPVPPSMSLRMTGAEDMMNPLMLAFMLKSGQAPEQALIDQAKAMIAQALAPPAPPPPPPMGGGLPQPPLGGPGVPPPPVPQVGDANPDWSAMPRINKRADDEDGGLM